MNKTVQTESIIEKLKNISYHAIKKSNYEKALSAIEVCAGILYAYNQRYKDDELENMLLEISGELVQHPSEYIKGNVIFYDGFGLDTRGIAINYCKAIVKGGYNLFYITLNSSKDCQPHLKHELNDCQVKYLYLDKDKAYVEQIEDLNKIFTNIKPEHAFFYTRPNDVIGTVVFDGMDHYVTRYQLDLTDHAFWLGINAFDIILDSRDIGQSIQRYERKIPLSKIVRIKPAPYIDSMAKYEPLPFDIVRNKYIFSGGQLYKTLGDPENTYYEVVKQLLMDSSLKFVYAGNGDTSEIQKLICEFPNQVYHYNERLDFYELIKNCTLYLNTYPMFGGLMMRYAAMAGKIPLTIRHGNDADGILIDQDSRKIEYDSADDLVRDARKLLSDASYLKERESLLDGATINFEVFSRNLISLIKTGKTEYESTFINVDTEKFREECLNRFDLNSSIQFYLIKRNHIDLLWDFPIIFIESLLTKIMKKLREIIK